MNVFGAVMFGGKLTKFEQQEINNMNIHVLLVTYMLPAFLLLPHSQLPL